MCMCSSFSFIKSLICCSNCSRLNSFCHVLSSLFVANVLSKVTSVLVFGVMVTSSADHLQVLLSFYESRVHVDTQHVSQRRTLKSEHFSHFNNYLKIQERSIHISAPHAAPPQNQTNPRLQNSPDCDSINLAPRGCCPVRCVTAP